MWLMGVVEGIVAVVKDRGRECGGGWDRKHSKEASEHLCPPTVTRLGSPPKYAIFSCNCKIFSSCCFLNTLLVQQNYNYVTVYLGTLQSAT